MCFWRRKPQTTEMASSKIRIKPEQVTIQNGILYLVGLAEGSYITTVAPTNSMEPNIDDGMIVILEPLQDTEDLIVGDIINYKLPFNYAGFGGAFHRITKIWHDDQGWACNTKGDNPICKTDPVVVRKEYITGVYRGVIT